MKHLLLLSLLIYWAYADINTLDFTTENHIDNIQLDGSSVRQSLLYSYATDVFASEVSLVSELKNSIIDTNSSISQNILIMEHSSFETSSIWNQSSIDGIVAHDSDINQGNFYLMEGSNVENHSVFISKNYIENIRLNGSNLSQGEFFLRNSNINDSQFVAHHIISTKTGQTSLDKGVLIQGVYNIDNSYVSSSRLETESKIIDTTVRGASLDMCSTYMNNATLRNVHLKKRCYMENSKISNGAEVSYGISKI